MVAETRADRELFAIRKRDRMRRREAMEVAKTMTNDQMVGAFNEWMDQYTKDPDKFEAEFRTVGAFLKAREDGKEPTYGDRCAALLTTLALKLAE